jgi:hypothetical protein
MGMKLPQLLNPIDLAKQFGVPQRTVAARLGVTSNWMRHMARHPQYARRVRVAVLEEILKQEKLALSAESLIVTPAICLEGDFHHGA